MTHFCMSTSSNLATVLLNDIFLAIRPIILKNSRDRRQYEDLEVVEAQ